MAPETWNAVCNAITAGGTVTLAVTAIWALVYARRQLEQAHESDSVRHLVRFIEQFEGEPLVGYRRVVAEKRIRGTSYPAEAQHLLNFFETIGLLVRRKYLDVKDVWSSFGYWMFNVYADFREEIEQEQRDDPSYYGDFCSLIEMLREVEAEHGSKDDHPSRDEIMDFWRDESKIAVGVPVRKRRPKGSKNKIVRPEDGQSSAQDG